MNSAWTIHIADAAGWSGQRDESWLLLHRFNCPCAHGTTQVLHKTSASTSLCCRYQFWDAVQSGRHRLGLCPPSPYHTFSKSRSTELSPSLFSWLCCGDATFYLPLAEKLTSLPTDRRCIGNRARDKTAALQTGSQVPAWQQGAPALIPQSGRSGFPWGKKNYSHLLITLRKQHHGGMANASDRAAVFTS